MPQPNIPKHFEEQAGWCDLLGSPFTAQLLRKLKEDYLAGGIIAELLADWTTNPRADALGLRFAGALHYAVLAGMSDALSVVYPSGTAFPPMNSVWDIASAFLREHADWAKRFIQSPPQTNETRRAFMLLIGLKKIAQIYQKPIHLLELGASAGLNQNFDAFYYDAGHWQWGDPASPMKVSTDWRGDAPDLSAPLVIHQRKSCDQNPLDLSDPETRLKVKSYIWADQPERLSRFDAAADIAIARHTHVEKADAADWLERELDARPQNMVTVVFHSVFFQYPPRDTRHQIISLMETLGAAAPFDTPLVWLRYEPENLWDRQKKLHAANMACDMRLWPGDDHIVLARSDGHVREVIVA